MEGGRGVEGVTEERMGTQTMAMVLGEAMAGGTVEGVTPLSRDLGELLSCL